ncbi:SRPBCC family protein [Caulobacter mirabilis]|uniref:Polyketide cyclase n=1 Tax=Caulobacter mirabilis TaxID=69666 RepID=A0A2D2AZ33_9CAUL|nr:SRPBCC family protein [Caulobacter mirabilis]ATQ43235.1 polyketide cyclase [Caulobacter mirabilis]
MTAAAEHELVLERIYDAAPETVFKALTTPGLLKKWFAPAPWSIVSADCDLRPGGSAGIVMKSPEGQEFPNPGVYLEVIPNKRIVSTDAFTPGWNPAGPFMVAIIDLEDLGDGRTKYTARARHWTAEAKQQHEQMGFHEGWGQTADQLGELLKTL